MIFGELAQSCGQCRNLIHLCAWLNQAFDVYRHFSDKVRC